MDFLKYQLTNPQSFDETNFQWASVPDLELDRITLESRIVGTIAEAGMNRRSCYVDTDSYPRQAALAFHTCSDSGSMGKLNLLDRPTQEEHARLDFEAIRAIHPRQRESPPRW